MYVGMYVSLSINQSNDAFEKTSNVERSPALDAASKEFEMGNKEHENFCARKVYTTQTPWITQAIL